MLARKGTASRLRVGPALTFMLTLLGAQAVIAEPGGRQRPPSDSDAPSSRVERNHGGGGSSSSPSGGAVSSPRSSGGSSSSEARRRDDSPSYEGGRTRSGERSEGSRQRIERPRGSDRHDGNRHYNDRHHYRRHNSYYYGHSYYYPGYYWGWNWYCWPWGLGWDSSYYYPRYDDYRGRSAAYRDGNGALDFDISPENAEIYVDGQFVGIADDLDGFPSYPWLPQGRYDVAVYLDGYQTLSREYRVLSGVVLDVEDQLEEGQSVRPESLVAKSKARPRQDEDGADRLGDDEDDPAAEGRQGEPGRLKLRLEPSDASIYLDGRFLGTARDLGRLESGLVIEPGVHHLQVVRPGYESLEKEIRVRAGQQVDLSIELNEET